MPAAAAHDDQQRARDPAGAVGHVEVQQVAAGAGGLRHRVRDVGVCGKAAAGPGGRGIGGSEQGEDGYQTEIYFVARHDRSPFERS
jgi:hypothetical protein